MTLRLFPNTIITTNGYTLTLENNSIFIAYDNFTGGLIATIFNNNGNIVSTRPVSVNTNMLAGLFNNTQTLILNPTSNLWEWTF
jgi:hypothetical protein